MPSFPKKWLWVIVALAFAVPLLQPILPEVVSNYRLFLVSTMIIAAIAVLGLNLLTGFNGQISLGHGAFYAVGAYTAAVLMDKLDVPYYATLPAAAVVCFAVGYLFGLPALKLEGHYLALATFALALAVPQILKYKWLEDLTGGVQGIVLSKPEVPFDIPLNEDQWDVQIETVLLRWQPGTRVVVYCDDTACAASRHVAERLRQDYRLPDVWVLHGGWTAWRKALDP